jgi:hypothetical protein
LAPPRERVFERESAKKRNNSKCCARVFFFREKSALILCSLFT